MYADKQTKSIQNTLKITRDRRAHQQAYNKERNITPKTIQKNISRDLSLTFGDILPTPTAAESPKTTPKCHLSPVDIEARIREYDTEMRRAAKELRFEDAAHFRDLLTHYRSLRLLEDFS